MISNTRYLTKPSHPTRVHLHMNHVPTCLIANVTAPATPVARARKTDGVTFAPLFRTGPRAWGQVKLWWEDRGEEGPI
jgi:hypothetical protein